MRRALAALPLALIALTTPAAAAPVSYACTYLASSPESAWPATLEATFDAARNTAALTAGDGQSWTFRSEPARFYDFAIVDLGTSLSAIGATAGASTDLLLLGDGQLMWLRLGAASSSTTWTCTPA